MLVRFNADYWITRSSEADFSATDTLGATLNGVPQFVDEDILRALWSLTFDSGNSSNEVSFMVEYYHATVAESEGWFLTRFTKFRTQEVQVGTVYFFCGRPGETQKVFRGENATVRAYTAPSFRGKSNKVQWTIKCSQIVAETGTVLTNNRRSNVEFYYPGIVDTNIAFGGWKPDCDSFIRLVELNAFIAPVGASIIVQLKDSNNVNIGSPCTLAAGSLTQQTLQTNLVVLSGTSVHAVLTQKGSTTAGQGLTVRLFVTQ